MNRDMNDNAYSWQSITQFWLADRSTAQIREIAKDRGLVSSARGVSPGERGRSHAANIIADLNERGDYAEFARSHAIKYTFTHDPGHGWVGVPAAELIELGISADISTYSYAGSDCGQFGTVWLEEDQDFSTWLVAKAKEAGEALPEFAKRFMADHLHHVHTNQDSLVRSMHSYNPD